LLDINEKFIDYWGTKGRGVENYFKDVWDNKLTAFECITSDPEVIHTLLLLELDGKIASLVQENLISVEELLKLQPDQIKVLANEKVNWALVKGHIKSRDLHQLSANEILSRAVMLYHEKDQPKDKCNIQ
jgi:hypothetical protein